MIGDEELERRLRAALTRPRPAERVDADDFLRRVHRGARARRLRRGAGVAGLAAIMLAGGGAVTNAGGLFERQTTPSADPARSGLTLPPSRSGTRPPTPGASTTPGGGEARPTKSTAPTKGPVTIAAGGPLAAAEVQPLSITATGTEHQWVLAATPGRDCGRARCASVLATADHGSSWSNLGQLPAAPAEPTEAPTPGSVSQIRFAARDDGSGQYDGWAFGFALWSTHDSGRTWSAADSPAGKVTALESWGGYTYAAVSSPVLGDDTATLYRTPSTVDDWTPVSIGAPLTSVTALAAADGVVGLIDAGGLRPKLYLSSDGTTWARQSACPAGRSPSSLSTAYDATSGVGALWVACGSATQTVLRYTDTTALGSWRAVESGDLGAGVKVAAVSPSTALAAGGDLAGIERLSASAPPSQVYAGPVGSVAYLGFTNATHGYLVSADGSILDTTNGGNDWQPFAVTDTP